MAMERPSRRKLYSEEKRETYPLEQTKTTSWCRCCAGCAGAGSCTAFCGRKLAGKAQPKAGDPDGAAAGDRRDHGSGRRDLPQAHRSDHHPCYGHRPRQRGGSRRLLSGWSGGFSAAHCDRQQRQDGPSAQDRPRHHGRGYGAWHAGQSGGHHSDADQPCTWLWRWQGGKLRLCP